MLLNGLNLTDDEKLFQKTLDTLRGVLGRPSHHPVSSQRVTRNSVILESLAQKIRANESKLAHMMVEQTHRPHTRYVLVLAHLILLQ